MSRGTEREIVQRYFLHHMPGKILDIPCGSLWLTKALLESGFDCHAADLFRECEMVEGVQFARVDMNQQLPYEAGAFDYIACVEGIEHMENTHHLLREFARILRPGGKLMITTPNVLSFKSRLRYLLRGRFNGFPHLWGNPKPGEHLHINPVNLSFLHFVARRSGLRLEQLHPFPIRRKDWIYAPAVFFIFAMTRLGLVFSRRPTVYQNLVALLSTPDILLSEVLIVSFEKDTGTAAG